MNNHVQIEMITSPSILPTCKKVANVSFSSESGALAAAHRLAEAVSAAIRYDPGATDVRTTAAEALAQGQIGRAHV